MSVYPTARDLGPLFEPRGRASTASGAALPAGEQAKREGIARAEAGNADFIRVMRAEAERIARERGAVHVDEVRAASIRLGISPKSSAAWGCVFSERGKWEIIGWRASEYPGNHRHRSPVRRLITLGSV